MNAKHVFRFLVLMVVVLPCWVAGLYVPVDCIALLALAALCWGLIGHIECKYKTVEYLLCTAVYVRRMAIFRMVCTTAVAGFLLALSGCASHAHDMVCAGLYGASAAAFLVLAMLYGKDADNAAEST